MFGIGFFFLSLRYFYLSFCFRKLIVWLFIKSLVFYWNYLLNKEKNDYVMNYFWDEIIFFIRFDE